MAANLNFYRIFRLQCHSFIKWLSNGEVNVNPLILGHSFNKQRIRVKFKLIIMESFKVTFTIFKRRHIFGNQL